MSRTWKDMPAEHRVRRQPGAATVRPVNIELGPGTNVIVVDFRVRVSRRQVRSVPGSGHRSGGDAA